MKLQFCLFFEQLIFFFYRLLGQFIHSFISHVSMVPYCCTSSYLSLWGTKRNKSLALLVRELQDTQSIPGISL